MGRAKGREHQGFTLGFAVWTILSQNNHQSYNTGDTWGQVCPYDPEPLQSTCPCHHQIAPKHRTHFSHININLSKGGTKGAELVAEERCHSAPALELDAWVTRSQCCFSFSTFSQATSPATPGALPSWLLICTKTRFTCRQLLPLPLEIARLSTNQTNEQSFASFASVKRCKLDQKVYRPNNTNRKIYFTVKHTTMATNTPAILEQ